MGDDSEDGPEGMIKLWPHSVGLIVLNDGTKFYCPQTLNAVRHIAMCYVSSIYDPKKIALTEDLLQRRFGQQRKLGQMTRQRRV